MIRNLRELYQYRALLWALSMRELKARYRASVLGFLWTFLNPTLNMVVYVVVFGHIMNSGQPRYAYFLFSGLLPWIFFSTSVVAGTSAVSDRRDLLTKVRFPAQVLPATVVLTNFINLTLSLPLLLLLGLYYLWFPGADANGVEIAAVFPLSWHLVLLAPVLLVQVFFTLALTYLLSALNVAFRDLQHIVTNIVQMLFFATPILWSMETLERSQLVQRHPLLKELALYGNPMAGVTLAWRDIFHLHRVPDLRPLAVTTVLSLLLMVVAAGVFERRREEFAELV